MLGHILTGGSYLVFPLDDGLEQALLGAIERKAARQKDEEDDSTAPHVHRLAVRLPLDDLWGHEMGSPDPTWTAGREAIWRVKFKVLQFKMSQNIKKKIHLLYIHLTRPHFHVIYCNVTIKFHIICVFLEVEPVEEPSRKITYLETTVTHFLSIV